MCSSDLGVAAGVGIAPTPPAFQTGVQTDYTIQRQGCTAASDELRRGRQEACAMQRAACGLMECPVRLDNRHRHQQRPIDSGKLISSERSPCGVKQLPLGPSSTTAHKVEWAGGVVATGPRLVPPTNDGYKIGRAHV